MRAINPLSRIIPDDLLQAGESDPALDLYVYPVIASQILERTGITAGRCLDLGSGAGLLGAALVWLSDLEIISVDLSPPRLPLAERILHIRHMEGRVQSVIGTVHELPFCSGSFDLAVSRGSFHSWDNLASSFAETFRILKPGGAAYIGGGYGSAAIYREVIAARLVKEKSSPPPHPRKLRFRTFHVSEITAALLAARIGDYGIIDDSSGFWVLIRKPE